MAVILRTRVKISGWAGGPGVHTFYFLPPGSATVFVQADVDAALARVRSFESSINGLMANGVLPEVQGQADVLDPATGTLVTSFVGAVGAPIAASASGSTAAPAVAGLITWVTSGIVHGRALKGAMFVSPLASTGVVSGVLSSSTTTSLSAAATTLIGAPQAGPALAVWSRPVTVATPRVPERPGDAFSVQGFTVANKLAILTSRRD